MRPVSQEFICGRRTTPLDPINWSNWLQIFVMHVTYPDVLHFQDLLLWLLKTALRWSSMSAFSRTAPSGHKVSFIKGRRRVKLLLFNLLYWGLCHTIHLAVNLRLNFIFLIDSKIIVFNLNYINAINKLSWITF